MVLRPCVPQKTAKLTCGVVRALAANLSLLQLMMELSHRLKKPLHFHFSSSNVLDAFISPLPSRPVYTPKVPKSTPSTYRPSNNACPRPSIAGLVLQPTVFIMHIFFLFLVYVLFSLSFRLRSVPMHLDCGLVSVALTVSSTIAWDRIAYHLCCMLYDLYYMCRTSSL